MSGDFGAANVAHGEQALVEEQQHAQEQEQQPKRCEPDPDLWYI